MLTECSAQFAMRGRLAQMPNCSAVDPATMMPLFPTTNCNNASQDVGTAFLSSILNRLTHQLLTIALSFFALRSSPFFSVLRSSFFVLWRAVVPYSQADCPYPLQFNERGTVADGSLSLSADEQICVYPCPAPMFTPSDWHASAGITISLASTLHFHSSNPSIHSLTRSSVARSLVDRDDALPRHHLHPEPEKAAVPDLLPAVGLRVVAHLLDRHRHCGRGGRYGLSLSLCVCVCEVLPI
jgi:hypothetical protein